MEIRNFLFIYKKISFVITISALSSALLFLNACQSVMTRRDSARDGVKSSPKESNPKAEVIKPELVKPSIREDVVGGSNATTGTAGAGGTQGPGEVKKETQDKVDSSDALKPAEPIRKVDLKLGLILGPGLVRGYAHVGILQEIAKSRLTVRGITGFEIGALVGGIFAKSGQPHEIEWQMMKLKEEHFLQKSLLGQGKSIDPEDYRGFLSDIFQNQQMDDLKLPFACSSLHINRQQTTLMSKGPMVAGELKCLPLPPNFKSYQQQMTGVTDMKSSVDFLKSKGANYIIFIDLLNGMLNEQDWTWALVHQSQLQNLDGIDLVVQVPLQDVSLNDFSKRREMIHRGSNAGQSIIQKIYKKFDL